MPWQGLSSPDTEFALATSIMGFDAEGDVADVGITIDDSVNVVTKMRGVASWLRTAHADSRARGFVDVSADTADCQAPASFPRYQRGAMSKVAHRFAWKARRLFDFC